MYNKNNMKNIYTYIIHKYAYISAIYQVLEVLNWGSILN